jgi:predicted RNA-binding Zn-ribbon protein involved in translation (DUF1610 family)
MYHNHNFGLRIVKHTVTLMTNVPLTMKLNINSRGNINPSAIGILSGNIKLEDCVFYCQECEKEIPKELIKFRCHQCGEELNIDETYIPKESNGFFCLHDANKYFADEDTITVKEVLKEME